jgi:hypothetical protein
MLKMQAMGTRIAGLTLMLSGMGLWAVGLMGFVASGFVMIVATVTSILILTGGIAVSFANRHKRQRQ